MRPCEGFANHLIPERIYSRELTPGMNIEHKIKGPIPMVLKYHTETNCLVLQITVFSFKYKSHEGYILSKALTTCLIGFPTCPIKLPTCSMRLPTCPTKFPTCPFKLKMSMWWTVIHEAKLLIHPSGSQWVNDWVENTIHIGIIKFQSAEKWLCRVFRQDNQLHVFFCFSFLDKCIFLGWSKLWLASMDCIFTHSLTHKRLADKLFLAPASPLLSQSSISANLTPSLTYFLTYLLCYTDICYACTSTLLSRPNQLGSLWNFKPKLLVTGGLLKVN